MTLRGAVVWLARAGVGVLAAVGALVLVVAVGASALFRGGSESPGRVKTEAAALAGQDRGEVVRVESAAACLCSAGASCTGPRGGIYCVTDTGGKRYAGKP